MLPSREHILALLPKNTIGTEVGVLGGDFTEIILNTVKPKKLYCIDYYRSDDYFFRRFNSSQHKDFFERKFSAEINDGVLEMVEGLSYESLEKYPDSYFDWIYLDTDHCYFSTVKEIEIMAKKVKKEGWLIFNDYISYNPYDHVYFGVIPAVHEFCIEYNWEMLYLALHPEMFCDVVIKKI